MKTIAFYNVKGGVAKTTSAVNVAYDLAATGKKVLIIDLDAQSNASDFFERCGNTDYTVADLLTKPELNIKEAIVHTKYDGLDIIPAYLTLGRAEKLLMSDMTSPQQFRLRQHLRGIEDDYDYCIIDCSPSAENLINVNGLACADAVFVPLKADKWAIAGLENTLQIINTISLYNDRLRFGGAFVVQAERRNIDRDVHTELKKALGDKLLSVTIRKSKYVPEASFTKRPLALNKTMVAEDYRQLTALLTAAS